MKRGIRKAECEMVRSRPVVTLGLNRRAFIKRGALFLPTIFLPRLIRAQSVLTADGLTAFSGASTAGGGGGGGNTIFRTAGKGTATRNDFSGIVGMAFTPTANITATDLGFMNVSGNSHTHVVYLEAANGSILGQTSALATTGVGGDTDIFGAITPVSLTSGTQYHVFVAVVSGQDSWYNDLANITTTTDATVNASRFAATTGISPSTATNGARSFGPVNFKYTKP